MLWLGSRGERGAWRGVGVGEAGEGERGVGTGDGREVGESGGEAGGAEDWGAVRASAEDLAMSISRVSHWAGPEVAEGVAFAVNE